MAEERNLGTARAPESAIDDDETKAELQRRMEEARESITQTVTEIKDTVTNQYQNVRETISQSLDWREQFRRRPVAFSLGALGVGFALGLSVGGAFGGADELPERYYASEGEDYDADSSVVRHAAPQAYAAQPITGSSHSPTHYPAATAESAKGSRPSYSTGYQATTGTAEADKLGLFERFKETKAYDRLQEELSTLGSRAVDELSKTAQSVVLPALLGKLKDLIGIDLSTQREVAQRSRLEQQTSATRADASQADYRAQAEDQKARV